MNLSRKLLAVFLFSIAMAYLESAVVVYLRELYYPDGFTFPIKPIPEKIIFIELGREFATIIMLCSVAVISGKLFVERISYFLFAFGVWDIFYYLWLKVFINWPESLLTDDLLFLIPVPWISPVLAPVLVSIIFISFSVPALNKIEAGNKVKSDKISLAMILIGVVFILISFIWDYEHRINSVSPVEFLWTVFLIGLLFMSGGFTKTILSAEK
ncbi:MAG: hypothetical protein HZC46_10315 [Ignavibacterium album]|uniref:hypothetical protein n=1 Tax=Ignavibacterium album TaxID=591197 RepID=UPI0026F3234A|nr:hypothetical protein [Ignavibacterium album]MBI5662527.1 hypothetical protein [Ignavibacterium album]